MHIILSFGNASNNEVEVRSLLEGLEIARDKGWYNIQVKLDSKIIVDMLNAGKEKDMRWMQDRIQELKILSNSIANVKHIYREAN